MEEKDFSLEKNIEKIREIVERLQKGMENFDEHLALMKEGLDRIKKTHEYLDQTELRIEQLVEGNWEEFPLDAAQN